MRDPIIMLTVLAVVIMFVLIVIFYPFGFWTRVERVDVIGFPSAYVVYYSSNKILWDSYEAYDNSLTATLVAKNLTLAQANEAKRAKADKAEDSIYDNTGK